MIDPKILEVATPRQREYLLSVAEHKSIRKAAAEMGVHHSAVSRALKAVEAKAGAAALAPPPTVSIEDEHLLVRTNRALKEEVKELRDIIAADRTLARLLEFDRCEPLRPLNLARKRGSKPKVAASAFLSDLHLDEVVNPAEVSGVNAYNRSIAERRIRRFAEKVVLMSHNYMSEFEVVALDLPLGGDIVSGNIHEELARSNDDEIMGTVEHWSQQLAAMVCGLAKEFKSIRVPCVVGNHGRNTKKPRHKGRVRDNFDWLIYCWMASLVKAAGCKNVTFEIAAGTDIQWRTFNTTYHLTHGDQASGGSGWGGIMSPIMRLDDKKRKRQASLARPYDILLLGHWHQFKDLGKIIINGSLKGYDEFAMNNNFEPEPPQQAFWLTDPRHGKILSAPLLVADGEKFEIAEAA